MNGIQIIGISKDCKTLYLAGGGVIISGTDPFDLNELNLELGARETETIQEVVMKKGEGYEQY